MSEREVVWESCGYFPILGIPLKSHHYTLYDDSITVRSGISLQKIQTTKLHNIITKEITASPIARLFHCGTIRLITRGYSTPDLEMLVKNPEEILEMIEDATARDRQAYLERKNQMPQRRDNRQGQGNRKKGR